MKVTHAVTITDKIRRAVKEAVGRRQFAVKQQTDSIIHHRIILAENKHHRIKMRIVNVVTYIYIVINYIADFEAGHGKLATTLLIFLSFSDFYIFVSVNFYFPSVRFNHLYSHGCAMFPSRNAIFSGNISCKIKFRKLFKSCFIIDVHKHTLKIATFYMFVARKSNSAGHTSRFGVAQHSQSVIDSQINSGFVFIFIRDLPDIKCRQIQ